MKIRADIDRRDARRLLSRALDGTDELEDRAAATGNADLRALLRFAASRRCGRVGASPPAHTGSGTPPDTAESPSAAEPAQHDPTSGPGSVDGAAAGGPRLLRRRDVSDALVSLQLSRPAGFDYRPGQHVKMGLPDLLRTYSLVSAPHEDHLEFFVELFPDGRLSSRLATLAPGAAMALGSRAKGKLALDGSRRNQLMVATVTGIAPYVSMLRDHFNGPDGAEHRFVVLHGASHADEFGYAGELDALARAHPGRLTYIPTVSRPASPRNAAWRGARGRVDAHLGALITRLGLHAGDTAAFACGNPDMVRNVAGDLRRRGFPTYTEPFD
jgi:ferredoxin-NADP reductase